MAHGDVADTGATGTTADGPERDAATALLRACHARRLEREGVPMILALVDERGENTESTDPQTRADGAAYADLLSRYAGLLTPTTAFRPDDEGSLITILQVVAFAHLRLGTDS